MTVSYSVTAFSLSMVGYSLIISNNLGLFAYAFAYDLGCLVNLYLTRYFLYEVFKVQCQSQLLSNFDFI